MANSIVNINDDVVASGAFMAFLKKLTPISAHSRNFSAEAARPGATIRVLREAYPDEAALTKTSHGAYTIQDVDSDSVTLTLGQPKYVSYGLDDVEVASSSAVSMETYGSAKGNKLATEILVDIWGEVTLANYGAAGFTGAATAFSLDDLYDLKNQLDDADAPTENRSAILDTAYSTQLLKELNNQYHIGDRPLREGSLGRLAGFDIFETTVMPDNGENLVGFVCVPDAMAVAMRYLRPQEGNTYLRAEPITDPAGSGITMGLRDWYSNDTGVRNRVFECIHDKETGNSAGLIRLVSV